MICVVIPGPTYEKAFEQIQEAVKWANFLEIRLDLFDTIDIFSLQQLLKFFKIPSIVTVRRLQSGGRFLGNEKEWIAIIKQVAGLQPNFLDLDYPVSALLMKWLKKNFPSIALILSYHNYVEIPKNLDSLYAKMRLHPAKFYKFALQVNSSVAALQLLKWSKGKKNCLTMGMGKLGEVTRLLAPVMGQPFTYACLKEELQTAKGQLTASCLKERYNYTRLNQQTKIFALIGDPVTQSLSDITHNYYLAQATIDAIYIKLEVKPADLKQLVFLAKALHFAGISVTMPLKEAIVDQLDVVEEQAALIGACNTIAFKQGKSFGYNTDAKAALDALEEIFVVKNSRLLILGAGGAAKAIAYEATVRQAKVTILSRTESKAKQIANAWNCCADSLDKIKNYFHAGYDVLINATSSDCPIDPSYLIPGCVVMEVNTHFFHTSFLTAAKQKKCHFVLGYEMFVRQACKQFFYWLADDYHQDQCEQLLRFRALKELTNHHS